MIVIFVFHAFSMLKQTLRVTAGFTTRINRDCCKVASLLNGIEIFNFCFFTLTYDIDCWVR